MLIAVGKKPCLAAPFFDRLYLIMSVARTVRRYTPTKHQIKRIFTKKVTLAKWELNLFGLICICIGVVLGVYGILSGFIPRILAASDITETWTFSTPGDYTLSDANSVEVTSNSVRLKARNYADDANTMALYHLDEPSGTSATDSSSNGNTGTLSGSFVTGVLNNALSLNGSSQRLSAADSASSSLGNNQTIEAWTKFNSTYSTSSNTKQSVVDKGAYQLYYDPQTAKVTYELADSGSTTWTKQAGDITKGSWDNGGMNSVKSMVVISSNTYVGLGDGNGDGDVWKWNGTSWSQIGGDGINSSWTQDYDSVLSMAAIGNNLYVGMGSGAGDGDVWTCNVTSCTWSQIGGDSIGGSWSSSMEAVPSLYVSGSTLYAGTGTSLGDARVYSWNGSTWTHIGGGGVSSPYTGIPNSTYYGVYSLMSDGTSLYAGMGGITNGAGDLYKQAGDGSWSQVAGDGLNSSWAASTFRQVMSMRYFGGNLYVGLGTSSNTADVWMLSSGTWSQIGGDSLNSGWATAYDTVPSMTDDGTNLIVGLGSGTGENEIWSWGGSSWTKLGGDGLNSSMAGTHTSITSLYYANSTLYAGVEDTLNSLSSQVWQYTSSTWTKLGGNYVKFSWGMSGLKSAQTLARAGDYLYAGTSGTAAGSALVWRFDGSTWNLIGGQGLNSSWAADTYESVASMTSYNGQLYVGIGTSTDEAEVWTWNGSTWSQMGGDSLNSGWTTGYESVTALYVTNGKLYAGIGTDSNDGELWEWNGSAWLKTGGDGVASSWSLGLDLVKNITSIGTTMYVGLGTGSADGEVWSYNGSTWTKIGGDGVNSSWTHYLVEDLEVYNGQLYASTGYVSSGEGEVWLWNGSNAWTMVGGDGVNSSWADSTFESARSLAVYNGQLYAGLGNTSGDADVWAYDGSTWTRIGGNNVVGSYGDVTHDDVWALESYKGKLYAALGSSLNSDASIWSWGNNGFVQSSTVGQNTSWHHIAASYDGTTMKLYIDGTQVGSQAATVTVPDTSQALLIGSSYGSTNGMPANGQGYFNGLIDEVRLSNIARSSFNSTPYASSAQTFQPTTAAHTSGVLSWDSFSATASADGGTIGYRLSDNAGSTWKYWNGSAWATSSALTDINDAATLSAHMNTFPVNAGGILWQGVMYGDGWQRPSVTQVEYQATSDTTPPANPDTLQALNQSGGATSLTTNTWYNYPSPAFSWSGASDAGSGVAGYYVYFGTDNTADPQTAGAFQAGSTLTPSSLSSGSTYYLRIKAKDNAQNSASSTWAAFTYKFDNTAPNNPGVVSASPSGYSAVNNFTFVWPESGGAAASDAGSGVAGFQYKTGAASGPLSDWSLITTEVSHTISNSAYQEGENTFYLRTVDNAGNVSGPISTHYYYSGSAPTSPRNVSVDPTTNTENSFSFDWDPPSSFLGQEANLTYCYTVNNLPTPETCTYTDPGVTELPADAYATVPGANVFYVVARDEASNISYGTYGQVTFTSNVTTPGIPLNQDIADVSVKSAQSWKLAISWEPPTNAQGLVNQYQVYRSINNNTFTKVATATGIAFVDTGLDQQTYYYKIRACTSVNSCGAFTSVISMYPDGKFTEPATLTAEPEAKNITTKQVTISWQTDRQSDSKVAYGLTAGEYMPEEPSVAKQSPSHSVTLSNLSPGTTYYYQAKWTDEDGNTGSFKEQQFTTAPAPSVIDPRVRSVGLDNATIQYTAKGASMVRVYYGTTESLGTMKEFATSTAESTYLAAIDGLKDGTKYYYKMVAVDSELIEYPGNILSFTTIPRPIISNVRLEQIEDSAQTSMKVTWNTNTEITSVISYYPSDTPEASQDAVSVDFASGEHELTVAGLQPKTAYTLVVKGTDHSGNQATSDPQNFTTSLDTRPPKVYNVKVEGSASSKDNASSAQLVVSWTTDEPATSQVELGDGTGATYTIRTSQDSHLTQNHLVVIPNLTPSKVYHLRVVSLDAAGNTTKSADVVTITPKAISSAINLVVTNLSQVFGFLNFFK